MITNLLLTPFAATVAFTPAFGELGVQMGVNPLPLFYAFEYGLDQYFFPYEGVMFLYIFTTGCVTLKHVIPTMIARASSPGRSSRSSPSPTGRSSASCNPARPAPAPLLPLPDAPRIPKKALPHPGLMAGCGNAFS